MWTVQEIDMLREAIGFLLSVHDGPIIPQILDGLLQMPSESNMLEMELLDDTTLVSLTKGTKCTI